MGFSLKKLGRSVTHAVRKPGTVLKKQFAVIQAAGAGFITGGPVGAVTGAAYGLSKATKTGKGPAITFRNTLRYGGGGAAVGGLTRVGLKVVPKLAQAGTKLKGLSGLFSPFIRKPQRTVVGESVPPAPGDFVTDDRNLLRIGDMLRVQFNTLLNKGQSPAEQIVNSPSNSGNAEIPNVTGAAYDIYQRAAQFLKGEKEQTPTTESDVAVTSGLQGFPGGVPLILIVGVALFLYFNFFKRK